LIFKYSDGTRDSVYKPTSVWENGNLVEIDFQPSKPVTRVVLGEYLIPDSNTANNTYEIERNSQ
jgi:hypothetical protein